MNHKPLHGQFYQVLPTIGDAPLRDCHLHGFETSREFEAALLRLRDRWHDRIGEQIAERCGEYINRAHRLIRLRFHDTPGGRPDEAWLPRYMLRPVEPPDWMLPHEPSSSEETEALLDAAFGFD